MGQVEYPYQGKFEEIHFFDPMVADYEHSQLELNDLAT